jgi:hypothetical protein
MGYYDSPNADHASLNCELSERRLRDLLNRESGFICRQDVPDYGCDFDVELIVNGKDVSDWRFPIQLKSIQRIKLIKNGALLAYSIETSRIGYLMRRKPAMGLIVLYDISSESFYYDFVDRIYGRIMERKETNDWQQKKMVTIHIPATNHLTACTVREIHKTFILRFENGDLMQRSYGSIFGLPDMNTIVDYTDDLNSVAGIQQFIKSNGLALLESLGIDNILQLLKQLPYSIIHTDKTLLLIAAVTYAETGRNIEANSCCQKLVNLPLTAEERFIYQYISLKVQVSLGYLTERKFLQEFKNIDKSGLSEEQRMLHAIMEISFRLTRKDSSDVEESIFRDIEAIFVAIESSNWNKHTKKWLALLNAENIVQFLNGLQKDFCLSNLYQAGIYDDNMAKLEKVKTLFNEQILTIQNENDQCQDKYLLAIAYLAEANLFITTHKLLFLAQLPYARDHQDLQDPDFFPLVTKILGNLDIASSLFSEEGRVRENYDCLCFMIEVIELVKNGYGCDFIEDLYISDLHDSKKEMEIENEFRPNKLIFPALINEKKDFTLIKNGKGIPFITDFSNKEIEEMATWIYLTSKSSPSILPNLISELMSFRTFHQRCNDTNISIFSLNEASNDRIKTPQFILRHEQMGIEKGPGKDISELLSAFGF